MSTGALTAALLHVRGVIAAALSPYKWTVSTAENPFQRFNALGSVGSGGTCVVSWAGDRKLDQANRSLVIRALIAVTLVAKQDVTQPALGKLQGSTPRLFEIHDRVKGVMLSLTMPADIVPEDSALVPGYVGSQTLTNPAGVPLDGLEQTWEVELLESFGTI